MNKTLLTLAALSALTYTASAENTIILEPLTVSSTAIETDELHSTDAVEVYTAEDIEKAHVQNVYEFLNQQTSVIAIPSYGNPFTQQLDIHGYGSNGNQNIVVTINGRRMNNIDGIPQLLSSISPASIEKIEIIKSSGIVVGGDGANAGVINITTKNNNDKTVTLYGGTYGTKDGSFYIGHSDDTVNISASGEMQDNDGMRTIDASGKKDESSLKTATFNLAFTPIKELEFRLGASISDIDVIYGGALSKREYEENPFQEGTRLATAQNFTSDTLNAGVSYFINDTSSLNVDGYHEDKTSQYIPYTPQEYKYNSVKASFDIENDFFALSLGVDGFDGERRAFGNVTDKKNLAGFLMTEWYIGQSSLKAGYRYEKVAYAYKDPSTDLKDDHSLQGAELGYNYTFTKEQSTFANYSHSFLAPDIDRFFASSYGPPPTFTPIVTFNGFINPMKANNYTVGYNYILPVNKFKISAYYIDLKDEIYLAPDATGFTFGSNTNIDKSHKYGLDIYDKWLISNTWNISLNYNYVQAVIDEEIGLNGEDYAGNTLPGVSNHTAKMTVSYLPIKSTTISLTEIYRSEAYAANDFNNDFTQKQDPYMSTDLSVTYNKETYEVFAKINNLFNQSNGVWVQDDAIYPVNFATTAIAGLKLKF